MAKKKGGWRILRFLREVRSELKRVAWPNRRETVVFTFVVIGSVIVVAAVIWVIDLVLSQILQLILT